MGPCYLSSSNPTTEPDPAPPFGVKPIWLHLEFEKGLVDGDSIPHQLQEGSDVRTELSAEDLGGGRTFGIRDERALFVESAEPLREAFEGDDRGGVSKNFGGP